MTEYSINPAGEKFPMPGAEQYAAEYKRLEKLAGDARKEGREIVVVMGLGFVGAVMAAIVADTVDKKNGRPTKFVIGCQRPSTRSYWKTPLLNRGESPVKAEDPEVESDDRALRSGEEDAHRHLQSATAWRWPTAWSWTCSATTSSSDLGNMSTGEADMAALEATLKTIGEKIPPNCLVLIETTVAPGTTEFVAWPILKKAFHARGIESEPLLAHSFERVMPGKRIRQQHPRFLAGLLRLQRRRPASGW